MKERLSILFWIPVLFLLDHFNALGLLVLVIVIFGCYEIVMRQPMILWSMIAATHMVGFAFILTMPEKIIWFVIAVVVTNDVASYFGGTNFCITEEMRKNPFPSISPKKTYGGYLYGVIFGTIAGTIMAHSLNLPELFFCFGACLSFGVCLVAIGGDLLESKFKRTFGIKDSGDDLFTKKLLPGHGGIYDRFDSLSAVCWAWFLLLIYLNYSI